MTDLLVWEDVSDTEADVDTARETAEGAVVVFHPNEYAECFEFKI